MASVGTRSRRGYRSSRGVPNCALADFSEHIEIPRVHNRAGNSVYRWQNHGEFNMVFNAMLNWNHVPSPTPIPGTR